MNLTSQKALALAVLSTLLAYGCGDDDDQGVGTDGNVTTMPMDTGTMTTMTTAGMTTTATTEPMTTTMEPMTTTMEPMTTGGMDTGTTGADTTAAGTADDTAGTTGAAMVCEAPRDACEMCSCDNCLDELEACAADAGCSAIRDCAQENMCTGADCLVVCGDVIEMNGGLDGPSAGLALDLSGCVEAACMDEC